MQPGRLEMCDTWPHTSYTRGTYAPHTRRRMSTIIQTTATGLRNNFELVVKESCHIMRCLIINVNDSFFCRNYGHSEHFLEYTPFMLWRCGHCLRAFLHVLIFPVCFFCNIQTNRGLCKIHWKSQLRIYCKNIPPVLAVVARNAEEPASSLLSFPRNLINSRHKMNEKCTKTPSV